MSKCFGCGITLQNEEVLEGEYTIFDPEHTWKKKTLSNYYAKPLHQKLKDVEILDSDYIKDNIRSDDNLKKNLLDACENYKFIVAKTNIKRMPIEQMEDVYGLLSKIDIDSITHMVGEDRQQFVENYNQVKNKIEEIGSKIDEVR